jgi:spore coat polysaccharide biosynthesis protein SpsF
MALLCAQRLARDGCDLVVATSTDESDDLLSDTLRRAGVRVCRGALHDVLDRFVLAAADLSASDIVVRATADNPVPDAAFVRRVLECHLRSSCSYTTTQYPDSGIAHGLSAEVMTVEALRAAHRNAASPQSREHVTPWIRERYPTHRVTRRDLGLPDLSHVRCTVDTLGDFLSVAGAFDADELVTIPWTELLDRLRAPAVKAGPTRTAERLALGTAQFGMPYGVTRTSGPPGPDMAVAIIRRAVRAGVKWIDTAAAYGTAESRVGEALAGFDAASVVTKLSSTEQGGVPLTPLGSLYRSLHRLKRESVSSALLHDFRDFHAGTGEGWAALREATQSGLVDRIGISVYEPDEAIGALEDENLGHLQIPINMLDWRWDEIAGNALAARHDVVVHARSVFLQGLLLDDGENWPVPNHDALGILQEIDRLVVDLGRRDRVDLCLAFVLGIPWVDAAVIGVETIAQLDHSLEAVTAPPLSGEERNVVATRLGRVPESLLDPRKWTHG